MRTFFKLFILLVLSNVVLAQQSRQYAFKHYSTLNGLASNLTTYIMQDKEGYIWIATENGLQRFDGNNFLTFRNHAKDPTSIPSTWIHHMFEDSKGRFWLVGNNNKVGIFDKKRFVFTEVLTPGSNEKYFFPQHIDELQTGEIILMRIVGGGVYRYDERQKKFVDDTKLFPFPAMWKPTHFYWDSTIKKYWVGCDSGIVLYDPVSKHANYRGHNIDNDPVIRAFENVRGPYFLYSGKSGDLFFITWAKMTAAPVLYRYSRKTNTASNQILWSLFGYHEIAGFLQQKTGRLWMYGAPFLAEWTDDPKNPFLIVAFKYTKDPKFEYSYKVFEDREGNIWMATDNGVHYFSPDAQIFNSYNVMGVDKKPLQLNVTAAQELKDGSILVGCWGAGAFRYDRNFNPLPLPKALLTKEVSSDFSIWDMATNPKTGDLWITLQGGSLVVYDQKKEKAIRIRPDIFEKSTIRQVDEDTSGNLWFGVQNGMVIKWDLKKSGGDPTKGYELICKIGMVQKIHYDYQGYIWAATLGTGLYKIDAKTGKILKVFTSTGKEGERLFNDTQFDMAWYNDSTLIVAAGCLNIINTKTNKVTWVTEDEGLPSNTVNSIQKDKNGILWLGMTNGLCRVNLNKKIFSFYDRRDGIAYDKFIQAGVGHLSDGRIMFYTEHDFLVFDPKDFGQEILPPQPHLTFFKLNNRNLSMDSLLKAKRVILDYDNTSIVIGFSGLQYLQQRKLHYYYMMEGLDKDWIHTDRPMEAIYNSLPPGDYVFKVKSENADGMTSEEIASIPIIVHPPFWKSWWFLSVVGLLIVLILYLIDKERVKRRNSLQLIRRQIRGNLKEEISETLNNINVLSEIAKIKADKNVEQAKEFIDQISDKSRYMNEVLDDTIWSIDPANDSMKKFVLRVKELTDGLRISHNVEIDLMVDNKVQAMELDMKLRYELLFFYKETMSFIVENTFTKQIFVNINKTRSKMFIEVIAECDCDSKDLKVNFEKAVEKRVNGLPATLDVLVDNKSFSAVLYVTV